MESTLRVYDAAGQVLAEVRRAFNHKRHSQRAAAQQRALDQLYRPGAVRGEIVSYGGEITVPFRFDAAGRSVCVLKL